MALTENIESLADGQTKVFRRGTGRGRRPRSQPTNSKKKKHEGSGMIHFVNATHPDDITSSKSISLIRSHVAKHSRALIQERKQLPHHRVWILPQTQTARTLTSSRVDEEYYDEEEKEDGQNQEMTSWSRPHTRIAGFRVLAPKRQSSSLHPASADLPDAAGFSPIQLIGGARQDAFQGFARTLSNDEQFLFDFYLNYVITNGYKSCYHKESASVFQASMRDVWVPFAMSEPSLIAAILHVACRNYATNMSNDQARKFAIKKLQYRLTCLSMAKDAIATQVVANDTTIALALIMASESFFEGDLDAFASHGNGIINMVTARGGLNTLGLSGFLTKSVAWSIYTPKSCLVLGPDEIELNYSEY